jgi:hypothetical protein
MDEKIKVKIFLASMKLLTNSETHFCREEKLGQKF